LEEWNVIADFRARPAGSDWARMGNRQDDTSVVTPAGTITGNTHQGKRVVVPDRSPGCRWTAESPMSLASHHVMNYETLRHRIAVQKALLPLEG